MGLTTKANFIFSCSIGALLAAAAPLAASAQAPATPASKAAAKARSPAAPPGDDAQAATTAKKKDPAEAQRAIDAGIKQLQAGKAEQAIQTFTAAIAAGNMPSPLMARALHQRGVAYRKAQKPAQAISDLTSALWLKNGLQDADRQDAVVQRSDAYREAGLPDQAGEDGRPAGARTVRTTGAPTETAARTAAPVTTASLAPEPAPPATSSGGGLFASLFGSGGSKTPAAAAQTTAPRVTASVPTQPSTSGWSSAVAPPANAASANAQPAPKAAAPVAPVKTAAAAPAAAAAAASTAKALAAPAPGIHARIALVRTDAEAEGVIAKLKVSHAAALGNKAPTLSQAQFGGMGAFVQVRVGPYANSAEAQAFCLKLKGSGLDCVPVDR